MILLWLLVALFLDRAQLQIGAFSYDSPFNGLGTVDGINQRKIKAPMAYRVLVPWLIGGIERLSPGVVRYRATVYEAFKIVSLALALAVCNLALGTPKTLLVAALLPMTFAFDYWCWAIELLAFAAALSGSIPLTLGGCLLIALSRETAPLVPLTFILVTGNVGVGLQLLAATLAVILAVRLYVGRRPIYCDRIMIRRNWQELKTFSRSHHPLGVDYSAFALLLTMLTVALIVSGQVGSAWLIPLIVLALGWTLGIARETRVFTPVLLWIAMGLLK